MSANGLGKSLFILALFCLALIHIAHAGDYHTGKENLLCSDCHTIHYSEDGLLPSQAGTSGPYQKLLKDQINDMCLICHDGTNPFAPDITHGISLAGSFSVGHDPNTQHSLGSSESPAGFDGMWDDTLTCVLCHNPHGNPSYRNLVLDPGMDANISVTYETGPTYGGLKAVQQLSDAFLDHYQPGNVIYRQSEYGLHFGLSIWCAGCHPQYYGQGGEPNMGGSPSGDPGGASPWIRHPTTGITLSQGVSNGHINPDYWWSDTIKSRPPFVSPSADIGTSSVSDNEPFCGTCHKAHGSGNIYSLIFENPDTSEPEDGDRLVGTCQSCHKMTNYESAPHAHPDTGVINDTKWAPGECVQCHRMHLGNPLNLFTQNENSLCYTCHEQPPLGYPAQEDDRTPAGSEYPGYFEYFEDGIRAPGLENRVRWPGMDVFENPNTYFPGRYDSPHRRDPDMPRSGLCVNCHSPCRQENPFDMLKNTYLPQDYSLCFDCHSSEGPAGMEPQTKRIADYFDKTMNNDDRYGHQIRKSTGSASEWPDHIQTQDTLSCSNCHNPHGSRGHYHKPNAKLISDQRPGWDNLTDTLNDPNQTRRFCFGCHVPSDDTDPIDDPQVNGIQMAPIKPAMDQEAHKSTSIESCYTCHGKDYSSSTSYNVHHPKPGGDCNDCHNSQGSGGGPGRIRQKGGAGGGDYSGVHGYHTDIDGSSGTGRRYGFGCELCHSRFSISRGVIRHAQGNQMDHNPGGKNPSAFQYADIRFHDSSTKGWSSQTYQGRTYRYRSLYHNPYMDGLAIEPEYDTSSPYITRAYEYRKGDTKMGWTDQSHPDLPSTCSTIWCHSNANPLSIPNYERKNSYHANPSIPLKWNESADAGCGNCHGYPGRPVDELFLSSHHAKHIGYKDNLYIPCGQCHSLTALSTQDNRIADDTGYHYHVNGEKDVSFYPSLNLKGEYNPITKQCTNLYCHSNGWSARDKAYSSDKQWVSKNVSWDSSSTENCGTCHEINLINTGAHTEHLRSDKGPKAACLDCHSTPANSFGTVTASENKTLLKDTDAKNWIPGMWQGNWIKFLSNQNLGYVRKIKANDEEEIIWSDPLPYPLQPGDRYAIIAPDRADHVNGRVDFKDGKTLSVTKSCDTCHAQANADTAKRYWYKPGSWSTTKGSDYCYGCHGSHEVNSRGDGSGAVVVMGPTR